MKNFHDRPVPWIVPKACERLEETFLNSGLLKVYKKDAIIVSENERMDYFLYVVSGIVSQAVVNFNLNKPIAMNIFIPGRVMGYLNFFTGENFPRRLTALEKTEILIVPFDKMEKIIETDVELYKMLVNYCELCDRSELNGMAGLFSMSAEDRLRLLFTNILCAYGYDFEESRDGWVRVPLALRRDDIMKIIYTSKLTLDRLLAGWVKKGLMTRKGRYYYIKPFNLRALYDWIKTA